MAYLKDARNRTRAMQSHLCHALEHWFQCSLAFSIIISVHTQTLDIHASCLVTNQYVFPDLLLLAIL